MRFATVTNARDRRALEAYLPENFKVVHEFQADGDRYPTFVIQGEDDAGWTPDGYVIPRLASGLIWATEAEDHDPLVVNAKAAVPAGFFGWLG